MKIKLKDGVDANDLLDIHDNLWFMIMVVSKHLETINNFYNRLYMKEMEFVITSLKSDRGAVNNVSNTHEEGRSFDLRTRDWTMAQIKEIVDWANVEFKDIAAVTHSGVKLCALFHNNHIHFQVKP